MRNIDDVNLYDLVPDSIRDDEHVKASIDAINAELQAVSAFSYLPLIWSRIDELDGDTLDHLAWQLDSKIWRDAWPASLKRSVIKTVIDTKSKKGTRSAVTKSLESLGSAAVIQEWHETTPKGTPHTFYITVTVNDIPGQAGADTLNQITAQIDDTKAARSLYNLNLALQARKSIYLSGALRVVTHRRLNMEEQ